MCGGKRLFLFFYMNKVPWIQIMEKPIKRSQYHDIITNRKGLKTATVQEEKSRLVANAISGSLFLGKSLGDAAEIRNSTF